LLRVKVLCAVVFIFEVVMNGALRSGVPRLFFRFSDATGRVSLRRLPRMPHPPGLAFDLPNDANRPALGPHWFS